MQTGKVLICLGTAFLVTLSPLWAQTPESKPTDARPEARSKMCDGCCSGCKPPPRAQRVTLRCKKDKAQANPTRLSATWIDPALKDIFWIAESTKTAKWSVVFDSKTPCQQKRFDPNNPVCEIKNMPGEYRYQIALDGCADQGIGSVLVK